MREALGPTRDQFFHTPLSCYMGFKVPIFYISNKLIKVQQLLTLNKILNIE